MDKIAFAKLIAYIQYLKSRDAFDLVQDYEIEHIETLVKLPTIVVPEAPPAKASVKEVGDLLYHMQANNFIESIKAYRTLTGQDLRESKNAIESYRIKMQTPVVANASHVKIIEAVLIQRMLTSISTGNNMLVESLNNSQINALNDFLESFKND